MYLTSRQQRHAIRDSHYIPSLHKIGVFLGHADTLIYLLVLHFVQLPAALQGTLLQCQQTLVQWS